MAKPVGSHQVASALFPAVQAPGEKKKKKGDKQKTWEGSHGWCSEDTTE